ncbi:hypothetical protein [Runella sp.]|uniref:hypothetical protein n=1 Tax=Runella sp. TaxID=1960881 RepID=UPI003D117485
MGQNLMPAFIVWDQPQPLTFNVTLTLNGQGNAGALTNNVHNYTDGKVVVNILRPDFERLVDSAFEQIRMYSKTDVAVNCKNVEGAW